MTAETDVMVPLRSRRTRRAKLMLKFQLAQARLASLTRR
jgi:hypothetical protein